MCIPRTLSSPERQLPVAVFVLLSGCDVPFADLHECLLSSCEITKGLFLLGANNRWSQPPIIVEKLYTFPSLSL